MAIQYSAFDNYNIKLQIHFPEAKSMGDPGW